MLVLFVGKSISQIPHPDVLCSDSLAGKGYVNNGDKKAIDYIKNQFLSFGLSQIQTQTFNV